MCCEDHLHCCPHNTVCNVQAGTCDSVSDWSLTVPWVTKIPAVVMVPENEHCDETSACPTGTTCCKQKSGTWACCLLPRVHTHTHCLQYTSIHELLFVSHTRTHLSLRRPFAVKITSTAVLRATSVTSLTSPANTLFYPACLGSESSQR